MARYTGPKVKLSRRVGVPIADTPKHTAKRQLTAPGMHGFRGKRAKAYGVRKDEKQKLRYHYSVLERQFRRYMGEATRSKGTLLTTSLMIFGISVILVTSPCRANSSAEIAK